MTKVEINRRLKQATGLWWCHLLLIAAGGLVAGVILSVAIAAPPKPKLSTPTVTCGIESNSGWIDISVCAGVSGAPAGFSLQWMTCADFASHVNVIDPNGIPDDGDEYEVKVENTWYSSDDPRLCKASFSGNASGYNYDLSPGQCITVRVGDLLLDNGASTTCPDVLDCGTCYVFRAFAHATSSNLKSDFTPNLSCFTDECSECYGALSHGGFANNFSCYVAPLTLGNLDYTAEQLVTILNVTGPASGSPPNNSLTKLAKQLITVKLSILLFGPDSVLGIGDDCENEDLLDCVDAADLLIGDNLVLEDDVDQNAASALIECLDNWISAHHLPDELEPPRCP